VDTLEFHTPGAEARLVARMDAKAEALAYLRSRSRLDRCMKLCLSYSGLPEVVRPLVLEWYEIGMFFSLESHMPVSVDV
jgi:hypothetical protein